MLPLLSPMWIVGPSFRFELPSTNEHKNQYFLLKNASNEGKQRHQAVFMQMHNTSVYKHWRFSLPSFEAIINLLDAQNYPSKFNLDFRTQKKVSSTGMSLEVDKDRVSTFHVQLFRSSRNYLVANNKRKWKIRVDY